MAKSKRAVTEYRSYYLPTHFPVLLLSGDYWKISDIPSGSLHFHNCLEIGICHSDSGTLEINGEKQTFHAGDVTVLPRNVSHHLQCPGHKKPLVLSVSGSEGVVPQSSPRFLEKSRPLHGRLPSIPLYFQQRGFSPHQLSGISYHPRAGRAESLLSDQCQKPVMLPLYRAVQD